MIFTCDGEERREEEELHDVPGGADWRESRAADVFMTLGDNTEQVGGANSTHCHSTDSLATLCHTLPHCHTGTLSHCNIGTLAHCHTATLSRCQTGALSHWHTSHCHTLLHCVSVCCTDPQPAPLGTRTLDTTNKSVSQTVATIEKARLLSNYRVRPNTCPPPL